MWIIVESLDDDEVDDDSIRESDEIDEDEILMIGVDIELLMNAKFDEIDEIDE